MTRESDAALEEILQAGLDAADGAALRLLREALPKNVGAVGAGWWYTGHGHHVWATTNQSVSNVWVDKSADTLAEAADACREALVSK